MRRYLLLLLGAFAFFATACEHRPEKTAAPEVKRPPGNQLQLKASFLRQDSAWSMGLQPYQRDDFEPYARRQGYWIHTSLTNVSTFPDSFVIITCSYEDFYVVSPADSVKLLETSICFSNMPTGYVIDPNDSFVRDLFIVPKVASAQGKISLKAGFQYLQSQKSDHRHLEVDLYHERFTKGTTIWSNTVTLDPME